jgi:hypothetical protein
MRMARMFRQIQPREFSRDGERESSPSQGDEIIQPKVAKLPRVIVPINLSNLKGLHQWGAKMLMQPQSGIMHLTEVDYSCKLWA